jgi:hypothetical protein
VEFVVDSFGLGSIILTECTFVIHLGVTLLLTTATTTTTTIKITNEAV